MSDNNEARRKAWLEGSWDVDVGSFFGDVYREQIHVIDPFQIPKDWFINRSFDWGSARPFSVGWWAEATGSPIVIGNSEFYPPRGTLFRIGEWYGSDGRPNIGLNMSTNQISRGILERDRVFAEGFRIHSGPADTMIFSSSPNEERSIAEEFSLNGVLFHKANKNRVQGWSLMREALHNAAHNPSELPGMYVFSRCTDWRRTVPYLQMSEKNPDDLDSESEDHVADDTRYRVAERLASVWRGDYKKPR
jgi:hypothetical protein